MLCGKLWNICNNIEHETYKGSTMDADDLFEAGIKILEREATVWVGLQTPYYVVLSVVGMLF